MQDPKQDEKKDPDPKKSFLIHNTADPNESSDLIQCEFGKWAGIFMGAGSEIDCVLCWYGFDTCLAEQELVYVLLKFTVLEWLSKILLMVWQPRRVLCCHRLGIFENLKNDPCTIEYGIFGSFKYELSDFLISLFSFSIRRRTFLAILVLLSTV